MEGAPAHTARLYVAPLLVGGLALMYLYRVFFTELEKLLYKARGVTNAFIETEARDKEEALLGNEPHRPLWFRAVEALFALSNYSTFMYLVCAYIMYDEFASSFRVLKETGMLSPAKLRAAFSDEVDLPPWWENEVWAMIGGGWGLLRCFTLLTPLFLAMTFAVSLANTCRHVWALRRGGGLVGNPGVDSTIMIIALPMVACMMSYRSVTRMWFICANSKVGSLGYVEDFNGKRTWLARLVLCQNMYTTNFMISDVYESWALLHFANLTLDVIAAHRRKRGIQDSHRYSQGLASLTNQGIYLFNFTCVLEAAYWLIVTSAEAFFSGPTVLNFEIQVHSYRTQVEYFFLGMGAIASTAAIGNVVTVELAFEELLEEFRPSAKFWSTKILVSIAFMQSLLLYVPPLSYLSVTEKDLFYASALCMECFAVSLLHLKAWVPQESWYDALRDAHKAPPLARAGTLMASPA